MNRRIAALVVSICCTSGCPPTGGNVAATIESLCTFTDPDSVRDVIHNFNRDEFEAYPRYRGGRPQTFTLAMRLGLPFSTWSLSKLPDYLVAEGMVTDICHEGLRQLLHQEGVRFQAVRTWKRSNDSEFKPKRDRIVELYAAAEASEAVVIWTSSGR